MRKISKKGLKAKLDKECSRIIRSRGQCQFCGNSDYKLLQCCHIFSRSNLATRWMPNNLLCLCAGCHFWAHKNPTLFSERVMQILGEYNYEITRKAASSSVKWLPEDLHILLEKLKDVK